jgi:hypothetical protein
VATLDELHPTWREEYRVYRYMEHLSQPDLDRRAADVFVNLCDVNLDGKISISGPSGETFRWLVSWTHVLEELRLRSGSPSSELGFVRHVRAELPNVQSPLARKAADAARARTLQPGAFLVKYGRQQHLRATLERGAIRINPASAYSDPSLNAATRDDELVFSIQPHPSEISLEVFDGRTGRSKGRMFPIGGVISKRSPTNYYVYCLSGSLAPRLFLDFDYEACLVIREPDVFIKRLIVAVENSLPGWVGASFVMSYIDPVRPDRTIEQILVPLCKHFRYSYQREVRLTWAPPEAVTDLSPIDVELGSLAGCCELVELSDE